MKVFISSTRKDLDLAKDLARRLKEIGLEAFTEEGSARSDDDWLGPIERRLRNSDEVIVLLTDHAIASARMMSDLGAAYSLHKKVLPIMVGVDVDALPPLLRNLPYIKYGEVEDYLADLRKRSGAGDKKYAKKVYAT